MLPSPVLMAVRFWSKVEFGDGCWLWTASTNGSAKHQYGQFSVGGRKVGAHRAAWTLSRGPIPDGYFVCHDCDVTRCVRPDHLFLGTHSDNMWDASIKGRQRGQEQTTCKHGHPFDEANTYHRTCGPLTRGCRACNSEAVRRYKARKTAA
jgi:hypothetical protein